MLKGKTESGFEFEVSDVAMNNYELVEVLAEVDTNPLLLPRLVKMLLGEDQKKLLMDHVRTKEGTVPIDAVSAEIMEIFHSGKAKNS
jgi:hypothetical protein